MQSKKIAYIINHLSFFYSHILPHAVVAKKMDLKLKFFVEIQLVLIQINLQDNN